ncbi:MAG: hypothetical protein WBL14_09170 [Caldicoprobacterales bacterium]
MKLEEIKQDLIHHGKNPDDFNITITENGYSVTPKWFYETKQIAKKEDKPIIEDVNTMGETVAYNLIDINDIAETLAIVLIEINNLKAEIEALKGGNE